MRNDIVTFLSALTIVSKSFSVMILFHSFIILSWTTRADDYSFNNFYIQPFFIIVVLVMLLCWCLVFIASNSNLEFQCFQLPIGHSCYNVLLYCGNSI